MKKTVFKRIFVLLMAVCMVLSFAGCFGMASEDFYRLPQLSDEYVQLQQKIDEILNTDAEYSAPASGSNRQAVQFEDLDQNGINEAIAFFYMPNEDMPLKIYIYNWSEGIYEQAAVIEGAGTNIRSIDYVDMNGDNTEEIVVGWQIAPGVSMMSVYSINDYKAMQLFSTDYTSYAMYDMSKSKGDDIVVIRTTPSDLTGEAEIYSLMPDGEIISNVTRLSAGIASVLQVKTGRLSDGKPGVFVESAINENSIVTDVLVYDDETIKNITLRTTSGISQGTVRSSNVYSSDINNDGVFEVPIPVQLQQQTESTYYVLEWYSYNSDGNKELSTTTYHEFSDGWYLVFPNDWNGKITVRRDDSASGERALIFSKLDRWNINVEDFLVVYTISDDGKGDVNLNDRVVLATKDKTIYAAKILVDTRNFELMLSDTLVQDNFHIIYPALET